MEGAALVAIILSNGPIHNPIAPDWEDFIGIILLLIVNSTIAFVEERNAGNAVKALMDSLAPKAKTKRDGKWVELEASNLVPGDMVSFKIGDIIPADSRLTEAINVSIDQAALTGESLPVTKHEGDEVFSGSTCKNGEAEGIVIATGANTFFGKAASMIGGDDEMGHLQQILAQIGNFCLISIGIFVVAEILVLYAGRKYDYRRGLNDILVLLIGGIPIAMPTVLSVTLAVGAQQLAQHKAIVTRITAIEEMAGVTILCSDKTGTLTTNKLTVDKKLIKSYVEGVSQDDILRYAAYSSRLENQDAIDASIIGSLEDIKVARDGIEQMNFVPFNPVDKRTEMTYRQGDKVYRATKGMTHRILDLCTRNKSPEIIQKLEDDVNEFAGRGLRSLAVALEEVTDGQVEGQGNGFELMGILSIFDPPREDTKDTIDKALALGVKVKMITGDQLAIAKETGRRLGMGTNMYNTDILKNGVPEGSTQTVDDIIMEADGFAGVFPEHKFEIVKRLQGQGHLTAMTGDGANDAPALSRADVGIAVEGATDAARSAADIVLTEPGLSVIIEAITGSRRVFQRMRNYAIYACAITIRIVVGFAVLAFGWGFDFPPFMVLIIALLNDGTIMTLSVDRVKPSMEPDHWDLGEIFAYAIAYGLYLAASTIIFYVVAKQTSFLTDHFGVRPYGDVNDFRLHSMVYLQVAIISQALIFVTRAHGWFFMERPSLFLFLSFVIAQIISSIIAAYANWGFTQVEPISGAEVGFAWIWNIIWFLPLDLIKFGMKRLIKQLGLKTVDTVVKREERENAADENTLSRTVSKSYSARTQFLKSMERRVNFAQRIFKNGAIDKHGNKSLAMDDLEIRRFGTIQAQQAGATLAGGSGSRA